MSLPCHPVFSPPFHNETDHRHLDCVSDLDQCVCVRLRRLSNTLNRYQERVSSWILLELTKTNQIEKNEAFSGKTIEYHRHIILDASLRPLPSQ